MDLGRAKNVAACRLHALLGELSPGGVASVMTATKANAIIDSIEACDAMTVFKPDSVMLDVPSLILVGRHDSFVGYRDQLALLDAYPQATCVVVAEQDTPSPTNTLTSSHGWSPTGSRAADNPVYRCTITRRGERHNTRWLKATTYQSAQIAHSRAPLRAPRVVLASPSPTSSRPT